MWPAQLLSWWRYKRNTESFDQVDLCWTLGVLPVLFYRWRAKIWVQWRKVVRWLELISRSPSLTLQIWSSEQGREICAASIVDCFSIWTLDSLLRGVDSLISEQKVKVPVDHCDTRVRTVCGDVMQMSAAALSSLSPSGKGYAVLVSDMCPSVSGIGSKDAALSAELGMCALHLALGQSEADGSIPTTGGILLPGGSLVIKLLEGEESQGFLKLCKGRFQQLSWLRPKATRSTSREIYLIGKGKVNIKHPSA